MKYTEALRNHLKANGVDADNMTLEPLLKCYAEIATKNASEFDTANECQLKRLYLLITGHSDLFEDVDPKDDAEDFDDVKEVAEKLIETIAAYELLDSLKRNSEALEAVKNGECRLNVGYWHIWARHINGEIIVNGSYEKESSYKDWDCEYQWSTKFSFRENEDIEDCNIVIA